MQNLTRFAEMVAKVGTVRKFNLNTKIVELDDLRKLQDSLEGLKAGLTDAGIDFEYTFSDGIHARYIETDTGWNIALDRGLHIYQAPADPRNHYYMGYYDLDLRPCMETKIHYTKIK